MAKVKTLDAIKPTLMNIKFVAFDFDGVFTDNSVWISERGEETVRCSRSDGLGLSRLKKLGIETCIISSEKNPVVTVRARKLGIDCRQGVDDKALELGRICKERRIEPRNLMFLGNDINDIPAFKFVEVPLGVADAHPDINPFVIAFTGASGGQGAVRELCDFICRHQMSSQRDD